MTRVFLLMRMGMKGPRRLSPPPKRRRSARKRRVGINFGISVVAYVTRADDPQPPRCARRPPPCRPVRARCSEHVSRPRRHPLSSSTPFLPRLDDLLRRIVEVIRRRHVEIRLGENLLALIDIGPFEPHHQRNAQADL